MEGKKAKGKKGTDKDLRTNLEATTLDRVHAAMLLQASAGCHVAHSAEVSKKK